MDRRTFLGTLAGVLLAAPLAADAQQTGNVYRVALIAQIAPVSEMAGDPGSRALFQGLRALGYVEGRNLALERRSLEGRVDRASEIVAEVVRLKVDVIVCPTNVVTRAAKEATTSIPIVMVGNFAPVEGGLVASLARPGGNVTGLAIDAGSGISLKRLQLFKEIVPQISQVAFVGEKPEWEGQPWEARVRGLGLTIFHAESKPTDVTPAFAVITREHADAIFVTQLPSIVHRRAIIEFAAKRRLPASYAFREAVDDGGFMSYGVNRADLWRRAATYVDKILKGAKPANLPVEQPTKFELVINLKTARTLGLTIPQSLLQRADQVIE